MKIQPPKLVTSKSMRLPQRPFQIKGRGRRGGFSLVEVVLALGLCAFALVSLMSLTPVSLDSARNALEITRVSKAFQQVTTELTQSKFANVAAMTTVTKYFDYDGNPTTNASVRYFTILATVAGSPIANQSPGSLLRVELTAQTPLNPNAGSTTVTICDMGY